MLENTPIIPVYEDEDLHGDGFFDIYDLAMFQQQESVNNSHYTMFSIIIALTG